MCQTFFLSFANICFLFISFKPCKFSIKKYYLHFIGETEIEKKFSHGEGRSGSIAKGFVRYDAKKDASFIDVFNRADDAMYENKRMMKGLV